MLERSNTLAVSMCEPEPYVVVICIVIGIALAFVTLKLIKFFLDRLDRKEEIIEQRLLEVINAWPKPKYTCSRDGEGEEVIPDTLCFIEVKVLKSKVRISFVEGAVEEE